MGSTEKRCADVHVVDPMDTCLWKIYNKTFRIIWIFGDKPVRPDVI